jgi:hypothetical protein
MRNKQRGMGLLGMFFVAMILVFTSMLVMTVVPSYIEYFSIKKVLDTMVADPQMQDAKISQIRESYTRRSGIDNITSVKAADLEISRDNGKLTLSAEYHVEKSLFANVGIYIDFAPTTAANGAP